jgi:hypothetical protein
MAAKKGKTTRRRIVSSSTVRELADATAEDLESAIDKSMGVDDDDDEDSLDEVVKKHLDPRPHGHRSVPEPDEDPSMRDGPSMGPVLAPSRPILDEEEAPDLSDAKIRSLEDLMARYPFDGQGIYYVRVDRKKPTSWQGHQCSGVLRPITELVTQRDFIEIYGGGSYGLIVYGPPKRAGLIDPNTGQLKPRALTPEIIFTVPYDGITGIPPNFDASLPDEFLDAGDDMLEDTRMRPRILNRPATSADAVIHRTNVDDARLERQQRTSVEATAAVAQADVEKRRLELEAEERAEQRRALLSSNRAQPQVDVASIISSLAEMQKPPDTSELITRTLDASSKEMTRTLERHKDELRHVMESNERERQRLIEQHQLDMERQASVHTEKERIWRKEADDERERGTRALGDERDRHQRELDRLKADHDRELERKDRESDRRIADLERQHNATLESERMAHARELRSESTAAAGTHASEKITLEERNRVMTEQIAALRADKERMQKELDEKSDLVAQMSKFASLAEAMGFARQDGAPEATEGGEGGWKETFAALGKEVIPRLPDMMRAAGETVKNLRTPPAAAQQQVSMMPHQAPMLAPPPQMPMQRLTFASENDPIVTPNRAMAAPLPQGPMYPTTPAPSAPVMPTQAIVPVEQSAQMPQPMEQAVAMPQSPAAPPSMPPTPSQAPPPPAEEKGPSDDEILQFLPHLQQAYEQKIKPKAFMDQLKASFPVEVIQQFSTVLTARRIIAAIQHSRIQSPFLKLDGKQWLKGLEKEARDVS